MAELFDKAEQFQQEVRALDRRALRKVIQEYKVLLDTVTAMLRETEGRISEVGDDAPPSWFIERDRLEKLAKQIAVEIDVHQKAVAGLVTSFQDESVVLAREHFHGLIDAQLPSGGMAPVIDAVLPVETLPSLIGFLADGTPLDRLFSKFGDDGKTAIRRSLMTGVATGQSPRTVAQWVRRDVGMMLSRALRITRTEMMRSYREATFQFMKSHTDLIDGWIWHSAASARTCAACWFKHGSFHPIDERMSAHVNCRCTMVPVTKSWAELGFPGIDEPSPLASVTPGEVLFDQQPDAVKQRVLGPARYEMYKRGEATLGDMVGLRSHPEWGDAVYVRSVKEIRARKGGPPPTPPKPAGELRPVDIPYQPNPDVVKKVLESVEVDLTLTAMASGRSVEEVRQSVREFEAEHLARPIMIRRRYRGAVGVFEDGRFKSQFETQQSGGVLDPSFRAEAEAEGMGVPETIDPKKRPIYGYFYSPAKTSEASVYGPFGFVLKDSVKRRTTYTLGDSLYAMSNRDVVPAPVLAPSETAWDKMTYSVANFRRVGTYVEAQIHGGVTLDDVERLVIFSKHVDPRELSEIKALAKNAGIPVEIV